jgi:serine/threonine protein kinase
VHIVKNVVYEDIETSKTIRSSLSSSTNTFSSSSSSFPLSSISCSSSASSSSANNNREGRNTIETAPDLSTEVFDGAPINFSFNEIRNWTEDFNDERIIGYGSFGKVYSGAVAFTKEVNGQPGMKIAVKKVDTNKYMASLASVSNSYEENSFLLAFKREVKLLKNLAHPNMMRLLGYCLPPTPELMASELCLIYKFAPRGDLKNILKDDCKAVELPWFYRLKILKEVAVVLNYLHNNGAFHRDVKTENILVESDHTAKLSDYGLSKSKSSESSTSDSMVIHSTVGTRYGTNGYKCPHYQNFSFPYNRKCEIFSFGIVVIEVVSGKLQGDIIDGINNSLADEVNSGKGLQEDLRAGEWPAGCVKELLQLGRECVACYRDRLDDMSEVIRIINIIRDKYHPSNSEVSFLEEQLRKEREITERFSLEKDIKKIQDSREKNYVPEVIPDVFCGSCRYKKPVWKGIECSNRINPHFICAGEGGCFNELVISQAEDHGDFVNNNSEVVCLQCSALVPSVRSLFPSFWKETDAAAHDAYIKAVKEVVRRKASADLEKFMVQHRHELKVRAVSGIEDPVLRLKASAGLHREVICESILTLHCPWCNVAWFDFSSCFAVQHKFYDPTTSKSGGCGKYFCGWCMEKCDSDQQCHDHVHDCVQSAAPLRHNVRGEERRFKSVNAVHEKRQKRLILQYLQDNVPNEEERKEVQMLLKVDLEGKDIDLEN